MSRVRITPTELAVLDGAATGRLWRSDAGHDLYASYLDSHSGVRRRKVNAVVDRLCDREIPLLAIGEADRFRRLWYLTEEGNRVRNAAIMSAGGSGVQ